MPGSVLRRTVLQLAGAALASGLAMLNPREAFALEAARELDVARGRAARFAEAAPREPLQLRLETELRLSPAPASEASEESEDPVPGERRGSLGLADLAGVLGASPAFGLVLRGVEYFLGGGMRVVPATADASDRDRAARGTAPGADAVSVGELLRNVDLRLGPVRWRALLSDEYRLQQSADGSRSSGFVTSGNASAASYLFQPWFAQLRGSLGFVRSSASSGDAKDNTSFSLTGDAGVSLFPSSRFPFDASFSVADSRASGEITGSDFRTTRIMLRQGYRDLGGAQYSARYERSMISGSNIGNDVLDVVEGTYTQRFGAQSVEVSGNHSSNTGGVNGTQSDLTRVIGRHSYAPTASLQVETLATYNQNDFEQTTASQRSAFSTRFVQVASFGNWRPVEGEPLFDENHPIVFTGGLRYSGIASDSGGVLSESQSASASAGVNYTIGPATRLSAAATATQAIASTGTAGGLSTSQNVNLTHAPAPRPLGSFLYSWNLNGGASNSTGGGSGASAGSPAAPSTRQSISAAGGHNLSRSFELAPRSNVTLTLGQNAGSNFATGGSTQNLSHSASAFWSLSGESSSQAYVSLSASDSRSFGTTRGDFQLVNLQATRQAPIGPLSFWTANLTMQGSRQNLESSLPGAVASAPAGFNFSTTGSVTYQHLRFFGVPRLRFFAAYTANQAQLQTRALGDLNAPREVVTGALDARLDYQIGKVDARLSFRSANVDHRRNSLLFLRVTRHF